MLNNYIKYNLKNMDIDGLLNLYHENKEKVLKLNE